MKIKYNKKGLTVTEGIHFENFCEVEVSDTVGNKLLKQKKLFKEISENKEIKPKVEKTEIKEDKEVKTTKPKTTRKTKVTPKSE